ncbi:MULTISPECIES: D-alanyl-D-alanine carboxypeptidase/D-alanyl-D-alanine-endopeptidase [unclassified Sphingopyxis]|uniref:D-alanyl-D-alanine carboxypeptidase/D-alanyl-D-alanine endopeptidase n=1 Tax=Sphingopyxis TaxID=165697 RepID=UPI0028656B54|nr:MULTISPECIES: D-alanyl-D-alanine carboxypeptidase/D-alanyl-D-alanine-endopeptidase [unclassified Sphingopyxis]MDR7058816.1 D-alanyl-D-alanine carboxypeptidase/D-alanyl-D-alanine-endopeptidase (penicillin-binding protein 4) [Sphingopyxis sp. BE235]MDR7178998.1 D-alanyl-D-alanine carboxypeptidase/D-alanyl-D-alanine-endopeptidase (penicillin-binding protein 4) [Sphingopyxis sp. BE249]
MTTSIGRFALASALALSLSLTAAHAQTTPAPLPLLTTVEQKLAAGPAGSRFGLLVTTLDGEILLSIAPDQRFIPASNTKMFTTAIAYAELPLLQRTAKGTGVRLETRADGKVDVVLHGRGDALLSSANDCKVDCLQTLADAVAAKTRHVRNIIGDDSWFPDERWGPGMSWNNIQSRYGTGTSALTLDDNELVVKLAPGAVGAPPGVQASGYYIIENRVTTVAGKEEAIEADRMPNSRVLRLTGTVGAEVAPLTLRYGIDDPAHHAAWRLGELLRARGVRVDGQIEARHRPLTPADDPENRKGTPAILPAEPAMLAELPAPSLAENMVRINKESQNLHTELMLRRVSRQAGSGSIADGQAVMHRVMTQAGLPATGYHFADGSGMSSYNRITPRAAVGLLSWIARQPWSMAWRGTLPIAGRDGTLQSRFKGTILEGKLFAKTGSLNASRALSGYLTTRSGKTLIFSALANDMPEDTDAQATAAVDRALVAIAEAL